MEVENTDNKIIFENSITTDSMTIKKYELNFLLKLLFYIKQKDIIVENPSIEIEKYIKLKDDELYKYNINCLDVDGFINENADISLTDIKNIDVDNDINAIKKSVKSEMEKIKEQILDCLRKSSITEEITLREMTDHIFNIKMDNNFFKEYAIIHSLNPQINEIINEDLQINLDELYDSINPMEKVKSTLDDLSKVIFSDKFDININNRYYENLKFIISNKFEEIINREKGNPLIKLKEDLSYTFFIERLYDSINIDELKFIYNENELMGLIYQISLPYIAKIENYNISHLLDKLKEKWKELEISLNIRKKMNKLVDLVDQFFSESYINDNYVDDLKKIYIQNKLDDYEDIKDIDTNTVIFFLKKLIGNKSINWLDNNDESKYSLDSLLYFYQKYN